MDVTTDSFQKEVLDSKIPVIIDFWAEWCGPCQMLKPVFAKVSEDYKEKLKFVSIDTDSNPDLSQKYGIRSIPCLVILNKGEEVERIVGFKNEAQLKEEIDKILAKL